MVNPDMILEDRLEEVRSSPELRDCIRRPVVARSIRSLDMLRIIVREHLEDHALLGQYLRWMTRGYSEDYRDAGFMEGAVDILKDGLYERDSWGQTALHTCTKEWVQHLVVAGLDIDDQDLDGDTPLHGAVKNHEYSLRDVLLEWGADEEIRNNSGELPLEADYI